MPEPAIEVRDLTISVGLPGGRRGVVVDDISFAIEPGGTLGVVGESGSGKTLTSLAIMGLLPPAARIDRGSIRLDGEELIGKSPREMQRLRGKRIGMVMQDPMTALDPSFTIRNQLAEPLIQHRGLRGPALEETLVAALEQVQLPSSAQRLRQYPHQLSGGMRQRVTSAIALAGQPSVLVADEPTTALDVTTQARYLQLLRDLQQQTGFALLLIAHDLQVIRQVCRDVVVMYAGQAVETGRTSHLFGAPRHPYTKALLASIPVLGDQIELESIEGQAPEASEVIVGCRFAARCAYAKEVCRASPPLLTARSHGGHARCWGTEEGGWIGSW
jgi:peptide/nickel transport system ATP-binding protein